MGAMHGRPRRSTKATRATTSSRSSDSIASALSTPLTFSDYDRCANGLGKRAGSEFTLRSQAALPRELRGRGGHLGKPHGQAWPSARDRFELERPASLLDEAPHQSDPDSPPVGFQRSVV